MPRRLTRIGSAACAAAVPLFLAAGASATTLRGVVVHDNQRAHSFVVAERGGVLKAVHASKLPLVGGAVTVTARRLRNGTWLAQRVSAGHHAKRVVIRGTVTYVAPHGAFFVLSARGASLLVHHGGPVFHGVRHTTNADVAVGDIMTVDGSLDGGSVSASAIHHDGQNANGVNLEGIVQAVDPTARTLSISADDSDLSGASLAVQVPTTFDLGLFSVGQPVQLIVSPNPNGSYTLEQSSNDSGGHQADNPGAIQGDNHGDRHASAEQQCLAQESDPAFPATHNGLSFTRFYERNVNDANNALGRCVDATAQSDGRHDSGSGGSGSGGSGGSGSGDSGSGGSGSGGSGSGGSGSGSGAPGSDG
jgi:uncharacterized membrane protein YgcG